MPYSTTQRNSIIDHITGGTAYTQPTAKYLALYTAASGNDPSTWTEVTAANGYARVPVIGEFAAASGGAAASNVANVVGPSTAAWGTCYAAATLSASTGGTVYEYTYLISGTWKNSIGLTTGTFYSPAHGFSNSDYVVFETMQYGALPGGITQGTGYYIISAATDTFQVSATDGGAAVTISSTGQARIAVYNPAVVNAANINVTVASGAWTIKQG